jgi:hypothetical protein
MYHSFMVRIWREVDQEQQGHYQITAESVQSGQTRRFDNLTSLLDFLHACVNSDNLSEADKERNELDKTDLDLSD